MSEKSSQPALINTVRQRLQASRKPETKKRTLPLGKLAYERFEAVCKEEGFYPCEVINEFIKLYAEQRQKS